MCGIAGRVNQPHPSIAASCSRMTERIAHRGPDDHGYHLRPRVGLGHRRLSHRRSRRRPPAAAPTRTRRCGSSSTARSTTTSTLRRELDARGHRFHTRSDTEAIVHAYEEWGAEAARSRLRGMFAFAMWDERARRARRWCATAWASSRSTTRSSAAIWSSPPRSSRCCRSAELDGARRRRRARRLSGAALRAGAAHAVRAACASCRRRTLLRVAARRGCARRATGISPSAARRAPPPTEAEAALELRERIDEAAGLRLMSEVPVGAFLSGGLDSTVITAAMLRADATARPLKTFSRRLRGRRRRPTTSSPGRAAPPSALGTEHREVRVACADAAEALPQDHLAPRRAGRRSRRACRSISSRAAPRRT